ncbi:MAG: tRNA lysidine(34) synthetase TilS [Candidatus Omnitrophica bacterium]|nr:tRNA lysidine(34) synthetase TilS [Candidatus Omnitrophota bacterium]
MFINGVRDTIKKYGLLDKGDRVVVAVSGGPDSTALLLALDALKREYGLKLHVAHLDHMFRSSAETLKDKEYVSKLARKLRLPMIFKKIDVPAGAKGSGMSLEEAAREIRYGFLLDAAKEAGANKIALGHTLDDQAETVLMRLIRGSGTGGLRGIPPKRPLGGVMVVRPLIERRRKDVEGYLSGLKVRARQDSTNRMKKFLRNRVRYELMAYLKKYNPNIKEVLARSARNLMHDHEALSAAVDKAYRKCARMKGGAVILDIGRMSGMPVGIERGILRKAIGSARGGLRNLDYSHIEDIEELMRPRGKRAVDLPGKARAVRSGNYIVFSMVKDEPVLPGIYKRLPVPGSAYIPELGLRFKAERVKSRAVGTGKPKSQEYIDLDSVNGPLYIRTWEKGDRFRPLGMARSKKLQDLFVDMKVPRESRASVPLLVCGRRIIWVCGVRLSDEVKVTKGTKRVLKVSYKKP